MGEAGEVLSVPPEALKAQARELVSQGFKQREVARKLDVPESTLRGWLKPLTQEELATQAFKMERRIIANAEKVSGATWELAKDLFEFHEAGGWTHVGYDTLEEFLARPELGMSRGQFFRLTQMWRDLVLVKAVEPKELETTEPTKVREVLPSIMRGEVSVEDGLADAKELGKMDLRRKYNPKERKQEPDAPLNADEEPVRVQCEACGSWFEPQDNDDDQEAEDG